MSVETCDQCGHESDDTGSAPSVTSDRHEMVTTDFSEYSDATHDAVQQQQQQHCQPQVTDQTRQGLKVYEMPKDEKMEGTEQANENENSFPHLLLRRYPTSHGFNISDSAIQEEQERKRSPEVVFDRSRSSSDGVIGVTEMTSDDDEVNHNEDIRYSLAAPVVDYEMHFHSGAENTPDNWQQLRWPAICRSSPHFDPLRRRLRNCCPSSQSSSCGRHVIEADLECPSPGVLFIPPTPSLNVMQLICHSSMPGRRPQQVLQRRNEDDDDGASLPNADGLSLSSAFLYFTPGAHRLSMPV